MRTLKEGEMLQQIGTHALRGPKGEILKTQALYVIVSTNDVDPASGLTRGEEKACGDFAQIFADKFRQYVKGVQAC